MYSYDPVALYYLVRTGLQLRNSEEDNAMREEAQRKEREWQDKWYNRNNNGIGIK